MKGAIVLALFAILASGYGLSDKEIETQLTQLCTKNGDGYLIADATDCHKFYECVGYAGVHTQLACGDDLVFNAKTKQCDYSQDTPCATNLF